VPIGGLAVGISLPLIAEHGSVRIALLALAATALLGGLLTAVLRKGQPSAQRYVHPAVGRVPLSSRSLAAIASWGAILVVGQFGFLAFALPYLIRGVGRRGLVAAGAIAMAQVGAIIGRVWWSWLGLDGRRRLAMITLSLAAGAAACLMAALRPTTPIWLLYALAFGYGCTAMGWNGLWIVAVTELAPPNREASAVGAGLTLVNVAAALGPWLLGAAYSLSGSFHTMWLLLGSLLACSFPVALLVPTPRTAAGKGAVVQTGGRRHVRSLEHRPGQLFRRKRPNDQ
jgi:MFS family permease